MKVTVNSTLAPENLNTEDIKALCTLLRQAAKGEGCPKNTSVNILLTDDENIRKINNKYRQIDSPTDVLSFPMFTPEELSAIQPLSGISWSLGFIAISMERCKLQAQEYGHSLQREFCFLGLHGMLHILGYDHIEATDAEKMETAAEKYLTAMGVVR